MAGQSSSENYRARILLVDDSPANLLALGAALESVDADVIQAASGYDALRHLLDVDFAAIILDVRMPGLDSGAQTLRTHTHPVPHRLSK
jgi:CheY-like chemotaxis protein